jgi:hypothetical protein
MIHIGIWHQIFKKEGQHMIQSIQAGSTTVYNSNTNVLGTGKVSVGTEQTTPAAQKEDETTTTSSQGDTLTISNAGAQKAAKTFTGQSANRPSVAGTSEETYTDSQAAALSSAAAGAGITEYTSVKNENSASAAAVSSGSSSSSSSSSESDLSGYTEAQLKTMLQNGEITQAEYEAEIKSRQEVDTTSDEESETSAAAATDETEA